MKINENEKMAELYIQDCNQSMVADSTVIMVSVPNNLEAAKANVSKQIREPTHRKPPSYLAKENFGMKFNFKKGDRTYVEISRRRRGAAGGATFTGQFDTSNLNIKALCTQSRRRHKS